MNSKARKISSLVVCLVIVATVFAVIGNVNAEEDKMMDDSSKNILIYDEAHWWYNFYKLQQELQSYGYSVDYVHEIYVPQITTELLDGYNQFWYMGTNPDIGPGEVKISDSELSAILSFHEKGGALLIAPDHDSRTDPCIYPNQDYTEGADRIASSLGVEYIGCMQTPNVGIWGPFSPNKVEHPIWEGVATVIGHDSEGEMEIYDPVVQIIGTNDNNFPIIAVKDESWRGRVVFESTFVRYMDGLLGQGDSIRYAQNVADWLSGKKPCIIKSTIDIDPDTLNLKSRGKWITCYIELPEGYDVADIDVSTILLEDTISAEANPTEIGDYDDDGIVDLMVKFDRSAVQEILEVGEEVEITVAGELTDGTPFEGTDTIRVIDE